MDRLEQDLGTRLHVIRLDVQEDVGRELAPVYDFNFTPTFIFFDSNGEEIWRQIGSLDVQRVYESLE